MPPQTTTEKLADTKARKVQLDCKLEEAQHEADREEAERAHKEHKECMKCDEEAAKARKEAEETEAAHEKVAAAPGVAEYKACVKAKVPMGEPIMALGSDSDIGSGVSLVGEGVTDLVSKVFSLTSIQC